MLNKYTGEEVPRDKYERAIAIFKGTKAVLLYSIAFGALTLINKDIREVISYRIWQLGFDPEGRYFHHLMTKLGYMSPKDIRIVSIASFLYASVFLTEGIGLYLQKRWAEYLTVIVTCSFVPLEVYELAMKFTIFKTIVILINIATIIYLILRLRKGD